MTTRDALLDFCFDGRRPPLAAEFAAWLQDSRRFQAFATEHQAKIRAKLRGVRDEGGMLDLRAELLAALLLLREPSFQVAYEAYAARKQRGPDFTVTYKTHTPFNVEVRRLRSGEWAAAAPHPKLPTVVCDKVGQMPPSTVNLLWLAADGELRTDDVAAALAALRYKAETKDDAFFARQGFAGAGAFLQQVRRLSAIAIRPPETPAVWLNPLARHPAPAAIVQALQRLGPA
jgi:hypothetical protein